MLELSAELRQETGRKNKQLRKTGFIPAVLYGPAAKNLNLSLNLRDFNKLYKEAKENTLLELKIEGETEKKIILIHAVAKDSVTDEIIHADLYQVKMNQPIKVEVPLVFVGQSEAVEKNKGILIKGFQALEIEALPKDLIHEIEVDISALKTFEDRIHIKDLKIPDTVKLSVNKDYVVASVAPPRTAQELEEELKQEAPEGEMEKIETEEKGKAEEKTEEKPAPASAEEGEKREENA